MVEFIQAIHWDSFFVGVGATVVFGFFGAIFIGILGEGL